MYTRTHARTHARTHTHAFIQSLSICCCAPRTPLGRGDAGHSQAGSKLLVVWMDRSAGGCETPAYGMSGGSTDTSYLHSEATLSLMVGQTCLFQAWKEQSGWLQCRALSETTRLCCRCRSFSSFHDFSLSSACLLRSSTLRLMVALQKSRSCACSLQLLDRLHCFRSFTTRLFHRHFIPQQYVCPQQGRTQEAAFVIFPLASWIQKNEDGAERG